MLVAGSDMAKFYHW